MKSWLKQILIALDQFINALFGGWADETMSSHAWRLEQSGKPFGFLRPVIDTLFWFDDNHCQESFESERARLQSPPECRDA